MHWFLLRQCSPSRAAHQRTQGNISVGSLNNTYMFGERGDSCIAVKWHITVDDKPLQGLQKDSLTRSSVLAMVRTWNRRYITGPLNSSQIRSSALPRGEPRSRAFCMTSRKPFLFRFSLAAHAAGRTRSRSSPQHSVRAVWWTSWS